MSNSRIYINGEEVYHRPYGYIGFEIDITPYVELEKENTIAVEIHQELLSARWYTGAGIYRNVWLETKNPVHVAHWGTYVTTPEISNEKAWVAIETKVENKNTTTGDYSLQTSILDQEGNEVASKTEDIDFQEQESISIQQESALANPIYGI